MTTEIDHEHDMQSSSRVALLDGEPVRVERPAATDGPISYVASLATSSRVERIRDALPGDERVVVLPAPIRGIITEMHREAQRRQRMPNSQTAL